ncbi:hypothetical protein MBLNU459_g7847t1 [Dothideomycetes sp. NU459]
MSAAAPPVPDRYKLILFTPPVALAKIKEAVFATGAGRYPGPGDYTEACFVTPGTSQFRPGKSAQPHIGTPQQLEEVVEVKWETICVGRDVAKAAVEAVKANHPYEEPAYEVYKMEDF